MCRASSVTPSSGPDSASFNPYNFIALYEMALSQYVSVSLSLLGLVGLTGAGVAVGKKILRNGQP